MAGLPSVPASAAQYITEAAQATGLPYSVVQAQNYAESGYGSNDGPSSAGAEGPWQFLPSTFSSLGFSVAQINSWSVSTQAYIKYMNQLLKQENGNVRNALAAYNAGPGNIAAGYGYADGILADAGQSTGLQDPGGSGTPSNNGTNTPGNNITGGNGNDSTGGLISWPGEIVDFFKDGKAFVDALLWLVNPASWVRIGAFAAGLIFLAFALYFLSVNHQSGSIENAAVSGLSMVRI